MDGYNSENPYKYDESSDESPDDYPDEYPDVFLDELKTIKTINSYLDVLKKQTILI